MNLDCTHIVHPLDFAKGTSQAARNAQAPAPEQLKIDGRTLADFLKFIEDFSLQVNHYNSKLEINDWQPFFSGNQPFAVACISRVDPSRIAEEYKRLVSDITTTHDPNLISYLVNYMYYEVLVPWNTWQEDFAGSEGSLADLIRQIIRTELSEVLREFVALVNGIHSHYPLVKPDFSFFTDVPVWDLDVAELFAVNDAFIHAPGGTPGRINALLKELERLFQTFQENLQLLSGRASVEEFIAEEALLNIGSGDDHPSHLALLYTFFRLFRVFQENTNTLTRQHLDHFYQKVLCIKQKPSVPDQVHVVFELQKFIDKKLFKEDIQLKDGKDDLKKDVFFRLTEDIVVNKAKVKSMRTLFLHQYDLNENLDPIIQGIHMAPEANSMDGIGSPFEEDDSNAWPTLGDVRSSLFLPGRNEPEHHPYATVGLVLASPILLLREGQRRITLNLTLEEVPALNQLDDLDSAKLNDLLSETYHFITEETLEQARKIGLSDNAGEWLDKIVTGGTPVNLGTDLSAIIANPILSAEDEAAILSGIEKRRAFNILFSGEKEWIPPHDFTVTFTKATWLLTVIIELSTDQPSVIPYNPDVLGGSLDSKLPLVKIEIDQQVTETCEFPKMDPACCLKRCHPESKAELSLYEYFKGLKITDSHIRVEVCGMKNVIVQNDENVMDVNGLILPFGSIPKEDANFYIGSNEIFCKPWKDVWVNMSWKDKPPDLTTHYEHYELDGGGTVTEASFKVEANLLQQGTWKPNGGDRELFTTSDPRSGYCTGIGISGPDNTFHYQQADFPAYQYSSDKDITLPDKSLGVSTRDGFLRLKLKGMGFHHDIFPYVLARHMMAIADLVDPRTIDMVIQDIEDAVDDAEDLEQAIRTLYQNLDAEKIALAGAPGADINDFVVLINKYISFLGITDLKDLEKDADDLEKFLKDEILKKLKPDEALKNGLPKEPYTPTIGEFALDYTAEGTGQHMTLFHLHAFENTWSAQFIEQEPFLFPLYSDGGTLYIGLEKLTPGSNLNLLFQLAETTADSESEGARLDWYYLRSNRWISLRNGFEILNDDTDGLTRSGIVKIAVPQDISLNSHTVMPDKLAWVRVSAKENATTVADTIDIRAQAVKAIYDPLEGNDPGRLAQPLEANKIAKLAVSDAAVKKVEQPYASFGGRLSSAHYDKRVSEMLHHRNRAQAAFDYERIILDYFNEVLRAKCIQHTLGLSANDYRVDLELAPGHVLLALIADISRLPYKERFAPRLPLSKLNRIEEYLSDRHSVFSRIRAVNPRYEKIHLGIRLVFQRGVDENYFREALANELRLFLSPWVEGSTDQLTFGRSVSRSSVLQFLENREYVDYVIELQLRHEEDKNDDCLTRPIELCDCDQRIGRTDGPEEIRPLTARSLLVAGDIELVLCSIECIEQEKGCDQSHPFHQCDQKDHGIN